MTFIAPAHLPAGVEPCPVCGGRRFTRDDVHAEEVCSQCGFVRDLPPRLEAQHAASTATVSLRGGRLPARLAALQRQGETGSEHRMRLARDEARRLASALGCPPDVGERAARVLDQARKARLTQGRPLDAFAPAALLASCRMLLLARTEEEVKAVAKVPWPQVQQAYRALVRGLGLKVPAMTAKEFLGQVASRVGLDGHVQADAYRLLQPVCGTARSAGKNPLGWGAAALLLAARARGKTAAVANLAKAARISPSTLLARARELADANAASA